MNNWLSAKASHKFYNEKHKVDQFHVFQENIVDLYTFFDVWLLGEFLGKKERVQTQNSLTVLDVPTFLLQTREICPLQGPQDPTLARLWGSKRQGSWEV